MKSRRPKTISNDRKVHGLDYNNFAKNVENLIKINNLNALEFSKVLMVSPDNIYRFLNRETNAGLKIVAAILKNFNVTFDELLYGEIK